jgi:hypothetical protein
VGPEVLAYLARGRGVEIRFEAPRPIWPFGFRARAAEVESAGFRIPLDAPRLALGVGGLVGSARLGSGAANLRLGWTGAGVVRLEAIELRELTHPGTTPLPLAGRLDGAARRSLGSQSVSAWVTDGSVVFGPDDRGEIPFGLLVIEAAEDRSSPGRWLLRGLHLEGPSIALEGSGAILADRRLRVELEVSAMNDLVRAALGRRGLPTQPLPVKLALRGTVRSPRLVPSSD